MELKKQITDLIDQSKLNNIEYQKVKFLFLIFSKFSFIYLNKKKRLKWLNNKVDVKLTN
jgi:hypothetical protein